MTCNLKNNSTLHESIKTFNLDTVQRAFKTDPSSLNTLDPNVTLHLDHLKFIHFSIDWMVYCVQSCGL